LIAPPNENGPGAAATAHRAGIVASSKPTPPDSANAEGQQRIVRLSLRAAVNAMCKSCIYDPFGSNGTWREQVQACSSANCPLHAVRPMTVKGEKRDGEARQATEAVSGGSSLGTPLRADRLGRKGPTPEQRQAA